MLEFNAYQLVLGLFNQYVFSEAKMNFSYLNLYFRLNSHLKSNTLIPKLLSLIESYNYTDITEATFINILTNDGRTTAEVNSTLSKLKEYLSYTQSQSKAFVENLRRMCHSAWIKYCQQKYEGNEIKYIEALKQFNYRSNYSDTLVAKNFSQLDITDLVQRYSGEGYKSRYKFINDSYTNGSYIPAQLVTVIAPPACMHGDTPIMYPDGTIKTLKELHDSNEKNISVYSYSTNSGELMLSAADSCEITKYTNIWIEVEIDGIPYKVTPEHRFLMRDGETYKRADELVVGDSLLPIYRRSEDPHNSDATCGGYEWITTINLPNHGIYTHRAAYNYLYAHSNLTDHQKSLELQVHHNQLIDNKYNKSNNLLHNLVLMTEGDHVKFHASHRMTIKSYVDRLLEAGSNTRFTSEVTSERNKQRWASDYDAMSELTAKNLAKGRESYNINGSWDSYNGSKQRVLAVQKYIHKLIEDGIVSTPDDIIPNYDDSRYVYHTPDGSEWSYRVGPRTPSLKSALRYYNNDVVRMFNDGVTYSNHSITGVRVIKLDEPEPAYDLVNVWNTHNFAVSYDGSSGFFVHNCGKSLFLQSEAVNFIEQQKRVHLLVMGDLNEMDIAVRMICQMSHKPKRVVESDIIGNFDLYKAKFGEYLTITCIPSGTVTAREYVDWMKNYLDEYDILMIDYFSNFKSTSDSMYANGGDTCDALTELTRAGKLVFLAAQPNKAYFREVCIPYEGCGESSRIVHISDMIITIGRQWDSKMKMGMFNIAKSRRGDNATVPYIATSEGLFYECSSILYAKYRSSDTYKSYLLKDLQDMDIADSVLSEALADDISEELNNILK